MRAASIDVHTLFRDGPIVRREPQRRLQCRVRVDGSVRFLRDTIDTKVLEALATIAGASGCRAGGTASEAPILSSWRIVTSGSGAASKNAGW